MTKIAIAIFIAAFFLLRPYAMQENGMWYTGDDYYYFAQASSIAFGQFPSYKNEFCGLKENPITCIGSGMIAAPFVFISSLFDRLEGSNISVKRTHQNIACSWSQFGFIVSSVLCLCLGCILLYLAGLMVARPFSASWAVILIVICQGIPLYAFHRPIFSRIRNYFCKFLWSIFF